MDVDVVLARIGKLFFFVSTLFIISISCAGGLYIESFAEELDVKYSVFEMNFNNLFLNVFIADQFQILLKTVLIVIAIVSFVYVYPKSLMLFYDFMYVL
ncbi:hypothetical protein, partial [Acinetobacter faecalis]|uniref:hypothetical protein n=1 Tax=Acinetobacter faecalis TaxID=2665161 RepID=UPI002A910142